ncbi:hypothetical protein [Geomesophilobacter sediminis]|uniref:Uncharacterized protein n=2 Tax=Geomesophilobacter sediminis TaxID=2798584 RepID=A0A8J7LUV0_9BACT|nr:hypothetical protein [Geomesophilobacter sediminis]MBJ6724165.1 hypothetical protein [Geomesophilobacter sediminis]
MVVSRLMVLIGLLVSVVQIAEGSEKRLSDAQVKKEIIRASIAEYPGNCPCPYNLTRNGSRCGRRSAYSRPGGYSPICYDRDVSKDMIREWRKNH